jgi:cytochrome c oxidase assembly protein subunit 15
VQFTHRSLAYLLLAMTFAHLVHALRLRADAAVVRGALLIAAATVVQAALGILTLLYAVPIDLALAHQAGAILVLTVALLQVERLSGNVHSRAALEGAPIVAISGGRR